jgi:hypothetical protein
MRRASLVRRHGVVPGERGTGVRPLFEGSDILLQGCGAPAVREWVAQCHGADTGLTHIVSYSGGDGLTGRVGRTTLGYDSQACQRNDMARIRL